MAQVSDEEGTQVKGFNYAFQILKARGLTEGELGHPLWNTVKKAFSACDMNLDIVRLSLICALAACPPNLIRLPSTKSLIKSLRSSSCSDLPRQLQPWLLQIWRQNGVEEAVPETIPGEL